MVAFTASRQGHDRNSEQPGTAKKRPRSDPSKSARLDVRRDRRRLCPKVSTAASSPPVPTNHQKTQSIQGSTSSPWYPYTVTAPTPNMVAKIKPVSA